MKKILYIIIPMLTLFACDKVYINGDLDGMWNLCSVELPEKTIYPNNIYYSFQRHLTQVSKHNDVGLPERYLGNLRYTGDSIIMWGFYIHPGEGHEATPEELAQFYLYSDTTAFAVISIDDENLVMQNKEMHTYTLRKW